MILPKVNTLKLINPSFPEVLRNIPTPPKQLYWIGSHPCEWIDRPKVAIVGSRKVSPYGQAVTKQIAGDLSAAGIVIISGLAYGVDSLAHSAALQSGGTTIAVLAGGLDSIYPASNLSLAQQILKTGGSLISEYPDGTPSFRQNFIARNRIVSGLADVLLITEATINSGTLHTARFALEQGKTVMAVPGNITSPTSEGTNNLIKSGAVPVTDIGDITFALKLDNPINTKKSPFSGTEQEQRVLELIAGGTHDQEDLAVNSRLNGAEFSSALTILEISGYIRPIGGGNWILT
jgi:DNA processing protein